MSDTNINPTEETTANSIAEELKITSEVEASEQQPIAEDPTEKIQIELQELKDTHLRLIAEFENYKRRSMKERIDLIKSASADTLVALLPVLDDFDRAVKAAASETSALKDGVLLIHQKMINTLENRGLKPMVTLNTEFDAEFHEAITNVQAGDDQKGKVVDEIEKGYLLNDKVIRYAKVVVGN